MARERFSLDTNFRIMNLRNNGRRLCDPPPLVSYALYLFVASIDVCPVSARTDAVELSPFQTSYP